MEEIKTQEESQIDLKKVANTILQLKLKRIHSSPFSKYIPITAQVQERDRQAKRAYAQHLLNLKSLSTES